MLTIRPATSLDVSRLPEIERSSCEIFRDWPGLEWIAGDAVQSENRHRELIAKGAAWVADHAGEGPVAFLNGEPMEDGFHLWQIAVHRDYQRRRIGGLLLDEIRSLAPANGWKVVTLTTFRQVPWNELYYKRLGFRILADEELSPQLRDILRQEAAAGLPLGQRCAMILRLA